MRKLNLDKYRKMLLEERERLHKEIEFIEQDISYADTGGNSEPCGGPQGQPPGAPVAESGQCHRRTIENRTATDHDSRETLCWSLPTICFREDVSG